MIFSPPRKVQPPDFPSLATSPAPSRGLSRMNNAFSPGGGPDVEGAGVAGSSNQIGRQRGGSQVESKKEEDVGAQRWERVGSQNNGLAGR